jgi:hypothetical protein
VISTARRIEYAQGFLQLNLFKEAAAELSAVTGRDRFSTEMLAARVELHMATKEWLIVSKFARCLTERAPDEPHGWIAWAYATRRLVDVPAAEVILLEAEKHIGGTCALLHYNLACYRCVLGDHGMAEQRLVKACQMDAIWKTAAMNDEDLIRIRDRIALMTFR